MAISTAALRKDAREKSTGQARYTADFTRPGDVYAAITPCPVASGYLRRVDLSATLDMPGVLLALTGDAALPLTGPLLQDRPILATGCVRYAGEPVAVVVAATKAQALAAAAAVHLDIEETQPVLTTVQALAPGAALVHQDAASYFTLVDDVKPQPGTNIAAAFRVLKGNPDAMWARCPSVTEQRFNLPPSLHAAMEPHIVRAKYQADGTLHMVSATQSPYAVREMVAKALGLDTGSVVVEVPYVGGAYGGKSAVQLEYMAGLAALRLPGRQIVLELPREQDMACSPTRMGLSATIKLGCNENGRLIAADMAFDVDCGAYSDIAPNLAKAIAVDCTGPYRLDHLRCEVRCVYTNHNYVTAFRGFSHESTTFCMERTIDELARTAALDPLTLRANSAIRPGDLTPTQVETTLSNLGNLPACIAALKRQMNWSEGQTLALSGGYIRAKGIACLWKTPNPAFDASAGAVVTFNEDGSVNLLAGTVEMGSGSTTRLAEFLAEALRIPYDKVHVCSTVSTRTAPKYWKSVASISHYLAGRAVMQAAQDALTQLKRNAALALRVPEEDLDYGEGRVYVRHQPKFAIGYQDLAFGVTMPDGNSVGSPVIGRGSFVMNHIGPLAADTGKGKTGQSWTVGAQGVEVEYNTADGTYRLLRAVTVMDVGAVVDPAAIVTMLRGGMSMGLSLARDESCAYDSEGRMQATSLRTYKPLHMGEESAYVVELVCTPQEDAPYGLRSYSEHGVIGMPAALGNALSAAANVPLNQLPLTPESVWLAARPKEMNS